MTDKKATVTSFNANVRALLKYLTEEFKSDAKVNGISISDKSDSSLTRFNLATRTSDTFMINLLAPMFVDLAPLIAKRDFDTFCATPINVLITSAKLSSDETKFMTMLQTALAGCNDARRNSIHGHMKAIASNCIAYSLP